MANVKTINGIFRKIGAKEARTFIDGIVTLPDALLDKGSAQEVDAWLGKREFNKDGTISEIPHGVTRISVRYTIVKEFNEQYE